MTTEYLLGGIVIQFSRIEEKVGTIIEELSKNCISARDIRRMRLSERLRMMSDLLNNESVRINVSERLIGTIREYAQVRNLIAHTAPYYVLDDGSEYLEIETSNNEPISGTGQLQGFYERMCMLVEEVGHLEARVVFRSLPEQ